MWNETPLTISFISSSLSCRARPPIRETRCRSFSVSVSKKAWSTSQQICRPSFQAMYSSWQGIGPVFSPLNGRAVGWGGHDGAGYGCGGVDEVGSRAGREHEDDDEVF